MKTVVFDTNSYRQFVSGKNNKQLHLAIDELLQLEKKKGLRAYAANVVGMELMANLAEGQGGVNFSDCKDSLIALSRHCYETTTELTRLIPPPYFHVAENVFGIMPVNYNQQYRNISNLFNQFQLHNGLPENFFTKENFYEDLKNRALISEEIFSNNLINLIDVARQNIIEEKPNISRKVLRQKLIDYLQSKKFEQLFGLSIISDVSNELGVQIEKNRIMDMVNYLCAISPLTIGFFKWITTEIISKNIDMKSKNSRDKRWNWLWDYHLTFLISENKIDGGEVILITSDSEIKKIISEYNFNNNVMDINEYLSFLQAE